MGDAFSDVRKKLKDFVNSGEDSFFSSAINSLYYKLTNSYPVIPDVSYTLDELQTYSNKLFIAEGDDIQKYYKLSIQRLAVLESKAEQAGAM